MYKVYSEQLFYVEESMIEKGRRPETPNGLIRIHDARTLELRRVVKECPKCRGELPCHVCKYRVDKR